MAPPVGLKQILELCGDPRGFVKDDGTVSPLWEARMVSVAFPAPLPLGWDLSRMARGCRVNQAIAPEVDGVCRLIAKEGLWRRFRTYDGGYAWRQQRGSTSKLSLHSFGAALDFNAESNRQGTPGDMDSALVQIFEAFGWTWGGRFAGSRIDPMHFQWGSGY